nr:MAG TPA: hypothetical protein [Caudoviricetes sp.]
MSKKMVINSYQTKIILYKKSKNFKVYPIILFL